MVIFFRYVDALTHSSPFELSDPISIKTEIQEVDLKRTIKERFQQALMKGALSLKLKPLTKPINHQNTKENQPNSTTNSKINSERTEKVNQPKTRVKKVKIIKRAPVSQTVTRIYKKTIDQEEKAIYYCHVCKYDKKITRSQLKEHFLRHDLPVNSSKLFRKARARKSRTPKPDVHRCEICYGEFETEKELDDHLRNHENQYVCDICNAGFKKLLDYIIHMQCHSEDNLFRCSLCDFTTNKRYNIRAHLYYQHEMFRKYKCDTCNKGFSLYNYLQEHKNFHTGDKPFQCDICGASFMYTRYLNAHKQNHVDAEKSGIECPVCKKVLATKRSYINHKQSHKNTMYICDACGKTFTTKSGLSTHTNVHTNHKPYKCKFCGRGFRQSSCKSGHERTHTGDKPHKCPYCGKGFSQRTSMVRHSHSHTGKRPYTCHLCKKGFVAKSVLVYHLKSCEGEENS